MTIYKVHNEIVSLLIFGNYGPIRHQETKQQWDNTARWWFYNIDESIKNLLH